MTDAFLRYLEFEKRLSKHTVLSYETDLKQLVDFLHQTFEVQQAELATFPMLRGWIANLVETDINPRSVNRKIACLRSFYKFLMKQEVISTNPAEKLKVLKTQKRLPVFVKESEIQELLNHAIFEDTFKGLRDRLIIELLYGSGMRLSELLGIKDHDIQWHKQTIKVLGKRNKERIIPFSNYLVTIIREYQQARNKEVGKHSENFLLLTNNGEPAYAGLVQASVKKYLSLTNAEKRSPHVLRHTYATHLLNKGAEINAVKDLLGHSSLAATQVYTHNTMEKLKKAFEQAHPKA
ncbi:MAG: tyrosine-type recombinase/integrase [Cyclobacteriaceae bacterium]|jgi:integrase/recombinase XerC|nr:tyrosine-type recombinase/integrase [Cytophagales bacterium]MCZ8329231.1 tyrosine-type recombinase/integrase [Cyclobacteriaceae bacterium]